MRISTSPMKLPGKVPAAAALDLLLGVEGRQRLAERPPWMYDNLDEIRELRKEHCRLSGRPHAGAEHADHREFLRRLGAGFVGGHVGIDADRLGRAFLGFRHRRHNLLPDYRRDPDGPRPADARSGRHRDHGVSFLQPPGALGKQGIEAAPADHPPIPESAHTSPPNRCHNPVVESPVDRRYRRPRSIRFKLPDAAATYRVMVDAHGDGRLGTTKATIVCGPPP